MSKKLPHQVSDQDLLDLIEKDKDLKVETLATNHNDVYDFIYANRLVKGNNIVTSKLLYKLYRNWSKNPVTRKTFSGDVAYLIENIHSNGQNNFKLNLNENIILKKTLEHTKKLDKTHSKPYKTHFDNYLNRYNIKSGTFYVKDTVLYNLYDKWTYENKKKHSLNIINFKNFCKLYFPKYRVIKKVWWFPIDDSIIKYLSEDMKQEMIKGNEKKENNKTAI